MDEQRIWAIERQFWLGGIEHFETNMVPGCLMVFPEPVGILTGTRITEGLRGAPRWSSVEFSATEFSRIADAVVLAYRAVGRRAASPEYRALCSSTYLRHDDGWRLIQHQQTPG